MKLPPARLFIAVILLGAGVVARGQVDISANLETYRTNRHMPASWRVASMRGPTSHVRVPVNPSSSTT